MDAPATTLLHRLLDDRPAPGTEPVAAVSAHRRHLEAWYAPLVGPLVLPDTALSAHSRHLDADGADLEVVVTASGGAGSVAALAGRRLPGLAVVAVRAALRDLDDLPGTAGRLAAAAAALNDVEGTGAVDVFVELPEAPGWVHAVEVVEAAGLLALVRTPLTPADPAAALEGLAGRLSVLVEADLPFGIVLEGTPVRPGLTVAALAMLVEALVDGADPADAAGLLHHADAARVRAGLGRWDGATATRVRRRLRSVDVGVPAVIADLTALGIVAAPG